MRTTLQPLQSRNLFALFGNDQLQAGVLTEQFDQQSFKLCTAQRGKGDGRRYMTQRLHPAESVQGKNERSPIFLPLLLARRRNPKR